MAGPNSSLRQDPLFQPQFTPVCSPRLIQRGPPLRHPRDLRGCTLLYTRRLTAHWQVWLEKAGVPNTQSEHGLWFESSSQVYQAAREGAGVALGQPVFLLRDLREGRLVAPFRLAIESPCSYWIASPLLRADAPGS